MKNCMPFLSALSINLTLEYQPCFAIDYNTLYGSKSYRSFNLVKYTRLYDMPQAKRWAELTRKKHKHSINVIWMQRCMVWLNKSITYSRWLIKVAPIFTFRKLNLYYYVRIESLIITLGNTSKWKIIFVISSPHNMKILLKSWNITFTKGCIQEFRLVILILMFPLVFFLPLQKSTISIIS